MLNNDLVQIYEHDLKQLADEIKAYTDESKMWAVQTGISNSAGNLTLHLIGNINHFIGATLGNTGYVRNRDSEFALKNIPRAELLANIEKTIGVVKSTLSKLTDEDLAKAFPLKIRNEGASTAFTLIHLIAHLNYHLGQINYHRRLLG